MKKTNNPVRQRLAQTGSAYRRSLNVLTGLKLLQFLAMIVTFWYLSVIVYQVIEVAQFTTLTALSAFIFSALAWVFLNVIVQRFQLSAELSCRQHLQTQLHGVLTQRQYALTRTQQPRYWQLLWLKQLPALSRYYNQYLPQQYLAGLTPLIILIASFSINWFVGLILLLAMPVVPLFMIVIGKGTASLHQTHFHALHRLGGMFSDRLRGLATINAFHNHATQQSALTEASDQLNDKTMKVVTVAFLNNSVLDFFSTIAVALVAVFVGFSLLGELTIGPAINLQSGLFLLLSVPQVFAEMKHLGKLYHQKAEAEAAIEQFYPVIHQAGDESQALVIDQHLTLRNFRVSSPTLFAPYLSISQGDKIRLSGDSGSGKSVLLHALMGWHPASHKLSGKIAYLTQSPRLIRGTLRENLSLDYMHDDQRLYAVLAQVELTEWLATLPAGLDTEFADHPPASGGQIQRIGLARILLQNAQLVLLDEPTAHLTEQQHRHLSMLIHRTLEDKTLVWASHKELDQGRFNKMWQIENNQITERPC